MATYLILNCCVMLIALLAIIIKRPSFKRTLLIFAALFILTAVFDSSLVHFGIIDYAPSKILGVHIGLAPIEDFFYPLFAVFIIPFLWEKFKK